VEPDIRYARSSGSGIAFADRGRHELKGVGEWELHTAVP